MFVIVVYSLRRFTCWGFLQLMAEGSLGSLGFECSDDCFCGARYDTRELQGSVVKHLSPCEHIIPPLHFFPLRLHVELKDLLLSGLGIVLHYLL